MTYWVLLRIKTGFEPALLGYYFTYCLLNTGGRLQVIIETSVPEVVLQKPVVVERYDFSILQGVLGERVLVAEARLADERDFWLKDTVITDTPGLTISLKPWFSSVLGLQETMCSMLFSA